MRSRLSSERRKLKLTQAELAERINLSVIYVRKLESGSRNPSVSTMLKFQEFFNIPMQDLFPDIFQVPSDTKCIKKII